MKKRKILYISGTRSDYGLMREVLFSIRRHRALKVEVAATGMHLMPEFGLTKKDINRDRFSIRTINVVYENDNRSSMAIFVGKFVQKLVKEVNEDRPDIILLLGDRGEMLGGAIVGTYLGIPVAHIHGGDVTSTVDEFARHATTKMSHIHFAVSKKSAERILKMGEDPWRVFVVGAPGVDQILKKKLLPKNEIANRFNLDYYKPILLVIQHSVSEDIENAPLQMKKTMDVVRDLGYQTVVIYPNADAGGRMIINVIEKYKKYTFIQTHQNLFSTDFLSLMSVASVLIGNSSSGIIEAPYFNLPVVNIGPRQDGRERVLNVVDVPYNKKQIKSSIINAIHDVDFKKRIKKCRKPYGDGKASERIADKLSKIKVNKRLLQKKIVY